uniref:Uncharacterized protein n=1 Tax=Arundo donax TaxID=35708 RepID=A0A0A9BPX7_ARUDO
MCYWPFSYKLLHRDP